MNDLTKQKAIELNKLFEKMLIYPSSKRSFGLINVFVISKDTETLKDKDNGYIRDLLYLARNEQKKFPELFLGDELLSINESSIRDFLRQGGFLSIYNKRKKERINDLFRFWFTNFLVIIAIAIAIYQVYISMPSKPRPERTLKEQSLPVKDSAKKDST